jgi:hypothetical protein
MKDILNITTVYKNLKSEKGKTTKIINILNKLDVLTDLDISKKSSSSNFTNQKSNNKNLIE